MLHFSIFGYIFIGLLAVLFIVWGIRLSKVNKQPQDFDMSSFGKTPGPGGSLDTGDAGMVTGLEEKLKRNQRNK